MIFIMFVQYVSFLFPCPSLFACFIIHYQLIWNIFTDGCCLLLTLVFTFSLCLHIIYKALKHVGLGQIHTGTICCFPHLWLCPSSVKASFSSTIKCFKAICYFLWIILKLKKNSFQNHFKSAVLNLFQTVGQFKPCLTCIKTEEGVQKYIF